MATAGAVSTDRPEQLVEIVQELQARLESAGDSGTRELAEEIVSAIVQMYGAGLERIVGALLDAGEEGRQIAASMSEDPLVATLLLIHDLHPVPLEQRVQEALDSVRPYMESHGGNVELLSLDERGIARIHLRGSCSDCSASSVTLELAIKQALEQAAPDLEGLEVEGVAPQTIGGTGLPMVTGSAPTGLELPVVMSGPAPAPSWFEIHSVTDLSDGSLVGVEVQGSSLVVANVEGTLLAYRDQCAACGGPLHGGQLSAGALACPQCARSFFLPRAGRSMDDDGFQLEPVPLLREDGRAKVALAG
ncbi:MAG: NifU family protein [Actinomycetota bacterium]|nr:NifU family protein [Actinomycetota bacterium]